MGAPYQLQYRSDTNQLMYIEEEDELMAECCCEEESEESEESEGESSSSECCCNDCVPELKETYNIAFDDFTNPARTFLNGTSGTVTWVSDCIWIGTIAGKTVELSYPHNWLGETNWWWITVELTGTSYVYMWNGQEACVPTGTYTEGTPSNPDDGTAVVN